MLLILCWMVQALSAAKMISSVVNTIYGPIEGNITSMGRTFTGIPFASPPIDDLRWVNPQPPKSWNTVLETKQLPPQCPQSCDDGGTGYWCAPETSEDCLFLNVWTPLNVTVDSALPVLLWIYGGGFTVGYSAGLQKNGTILANKTNTIVVSMNYRVGAMGFYYNQDLDIYGNFGYWDQLYAIEWVYNNIAAFGGNQNKITIFGESAGAHSVVLHVLNKTSLINGAIIESFFGGAKLSTTNKWNNGASNKFVSQCGCNNVSKDKEIECLKNLSWQEIVQKQSNIGWSPTVNTSVFPTDPIFSFQKGEFNQNIPFIIGMNLGEYYFMMSGETKVTYSQLENQLNNDIGSTNAQLVLKFYNCTNKPKDYNFVNETAEIFTDLNVKCSSRNVTASQSMYGNKNGIYSYYYHFAHISSFILKEPGTNPLCLYAPCHTTEIPYVYSDDLSPINISFTQQEILLSQQFQFYWSNMANNLDPNKGFKVNVNWPAYNNRNRDILYLDVGDKMVVNQASDENICNFWDSLNYNWLFAG